MKYLSLAALLLGACVQAGQAGPFNAVDWALASVDGQPAGYTATLNIGESGRATGQAPCNRYSADLAHDASTFKLGAIGATRMACLQIKGEAEFFQALQGVETYELASGELTLTGGGHVMVFVQPIN